MGTCRENCLTGLLVASCSGILSRRPSRRSPSRNRRRSCRWAAGCGGFEVRVATALAVPEVGRSGRLGSFADGRTRAWLQPTVGSTFRGFRRDFSELCRETFGGSLQVTIMLEHIPKTKDELPLDCRLRGTAGGNAFRQWIQTSAEASRDGCAGSFTDGRLGCFAR